MPTVEVCKKKIFQMGLKLGVSPKLIATRLLSEDDKKDMVDGLISNEELEVAVRCWMQSGMANVVEGDLRPYRPPPELPMQRYRGIGKSG